MNKFLLIFLLLPVVSLSQVKTKKVIKPSVHKTVAVQKAADEYLINASITGYADGTKVELLNGQSGTPEQTTQIQKNKFTFKGKIGTPDFKILLFNSQPPYVTLFLDNSVVKIVGSKDSLTKVKVTGSKAHTDYQAYNTQLAPYQFVFNENAPYDSAAENKALQITKDFATKHPTSFVAPLAVIQYNQLGDENDQTKQLYDSLDANVKITPMGNYIVQLMEDAKKNAIGTVIPDFTQNDTAGKPVSLRSFRGKYVLVDFWASWCRPCRQENPNVVAAYNRFHNKNFTVLGVSLDKDKSQWVNAITMDNLTWTHVSDLQGWSNAAAQKFQIFSIPQNILIDADGKIVGKNLRGEKLTRKLSKILK